MRDSCRGVRTNIPRGGDSGSAPALQRATPRCLNVLLAGKPRLVAKLQPAVARRGLQPPRGPTPLSCEGVARLRRRPSRRQAVTMWTRPADRAPSYGPCGQGVDKLQGTCPPLVHTRRPRAHILTASTTILHGKGNFTTKRFPHCSVIPGNPSTEQTGQFPRGFHEEMRETTITLNRRIWHLSAMRRCSDMKLSCACANRRKTS